MIEALGFDRCAILNGRIAPEFHMYPRGKSIRGMRAAYDTYIDGPQDNVQDNDDDMSITVVRSIEEFMRVGNDPQRNLHRRTGLPLRRGVRRQ